MPSPLSKLPLAPRSFWRGALIGLILTALACAPGQPPEPESPPDGDGQTADAITTNAVTEPGLGTGGFYLDFAQPVNGYAEQMLSEYALLGVRWIRIQLNWQGNTPDRFYRRFVELAHARGLKVVALLDATYTGNDDDGWQRDNFIANFIGDGVSPPVNKSLHHFATVVFGSSPVSRPDAYEIINEPNVCTIPGNTCSNTGFHVGGRTFAWLLRRVQQWKARYGRQELIVSGGILNTYFSSEPAWWDRFLNESSAWSEGGVRPFDYFGIHPYNPWNIDTGGCLNQYRSGCFAPWQSATAQMLNDLRTRVSNLPYVGWGWSYFVTEIGWQLSDNGNACPNAVNCVRTSAQEQEGMVATWQTVSAANSTTMIWYDYRDDPSWVAPGRFGLRGQWDGARYPAKPVWQTFRSLSGWGATDPEQTWGIRFSDSLAPFDFYVENLSQRGIIDGVWNGSSWVFNTNANAPRRLVVRWVMRARPWEFNIGGAPHFWDAPASDADFNYIETAVNRGIISGYADGSFHPDADVTRGQMAKILCLAMGYPLANPPTPTFSDVPYGSTFYQYIETLVARGIVGGYADGTFRPGNPVTRGQLTKFIYNANP